MSIPTSLVFANGGLIVAQAPDTLFLQDTDGDDKADVRKVLFTGWGTRDTHAGPNNLRYGFDNWIWGIVGYSGFEGTVGGKPMRFSQGVFRLKPDGSAMEFLTSLSNNAWGLGFSETNQIFASTANNQHSVHLAIPNRYYESVRGWHGLGSAGIAESERYYPITEFHRQMDWHGKFTAAAGHALYTARAFPKEYWNRVAFVTEGTGHLIHRAVLEPVGSGFVTRNGYNFLASHDEWTSPVSAEVGPDGAVWVSDWYSYIFQHNPTPVGFETGKGNAYVTPLRDKAHGRVYRIVHEDGANRTPARKPEADVDQLIAMLGDDNLFRRLEAQRWLVERANLDIAPKLADLTRRTELDAIGNTPAALHALWTLNGLGAFGGDAGSRLAGVPLDALKHPAAAVRKAALDVLPQNEKYRDAMLASNALSDADATVRLAALLALSEMPPSDSAGQAVADMIRSAKNAQDRWIPDAATAAAARHDRGFLATALIAARNMSATNRSAVQNLVTNGSFEEVSGVIPAGWSLTNWQGAADAASSESHVIAGAKCLQLQANADSGADSSVSVVVNVSPKTNYRLSGQIRAKGVKKGSGLGALLNVHELTDPIRVATKAVTGYADWTRVQTSFNSGEHSQLTINCLLGGWGKSTGTAWFDDIRLEPIGEAGGVVETMLGVVTAHHAQQARIDTVVATLSAIEGADDASAQTVLDGFLIGWPTDAAKLISDPTADAALLKVSASLSTDNRIRLATLMQRLGRGELFAEQTAQAQRELVASIGDSSLDDASRVDAARRLLTLGDTAANVETVFEHVTPQMSPAIAAALISTISASRQDAAGSLLLKKWNTLSPASRKSAIDVLLRRAAWHSALLDAMEKGTISRGDLTAEQAQQLVAVAATPDFAKRARTVLAPKSRTLDADRQKVIDKLLPLADQRGDSAAGKTPFEKNCAVCHTFAGQGGRVGPDLTGIGKNPRREILVNILDPNRSVEGNFKLWIVQTNDGQTLTGRLETESQTTVELLDASGKQHAIQRKDIRRMASQPTSIMPEGFELLPQADLVNLLEFLAQPPAGGQ